LLGFSYQSRFFGQDILSAGKQNPRALLANYQTVGFLQDGVLVELRPKGAYRIATLQAHGAAIRQRTSRVLDQAVSYYQVASDAYRTGALKVRPQVEPHPAVAGDCRRARCGRSPAQNELRGHCGAKQPLDVAEQFVFLVRFAEVLVDADLERQTAVFLGRARR